MSKNKVVIIAGPTATGKSDIAINLAKEINGEIISADSRQVYKYLDIGTNKVTKDEMSGIKHYMIDVTLPNNIYDISQFKKDGKDALNKIFNENKIPIIVGGTGYYIQSLIKDIDFTNEEKDIEYRNYLETLSNEELYNLLFESDKEAADNIHINNRRRIIRALEFNHNNEILFSENNTLQSNKKSPYDCYFFVLNDHRNVLYEKINKRVDKMIELGLVDEIKNIIDMGYLDDLRTINTIGYKEILDYLDNIITKDEAIELIKKNTRNYAKRQVTWFKREKDADWINLYDFENKDVIIKYIREKIHE